MSAFQVSHLHDLNSFSPRCPLRCIALIDLDGFYAQCETLRLSLPTTTPLVVRQWNAIIAMNYPAKYAGVKRGMHFEAAKKLCPDVVVQHVATWRNGEWGYWDDIEQKIGEEKSALDPYREESKKILGVIVREVGSQARVERASVDEFYVDLSRLVYEDLIEKWPVLREALKGDKKDHLPLPDAERLEWGGDGLPCAETASVRIDWDVICLNIGARITRKLREEVFAELKYTCSAGIARNKIIAKLGGGYQKPSGQTVVLPDAERSFIKTFNLNKVAGFKRKLGVEIIEGLGTTSLNEMAKLSRETLDHKLGSANSSLLRSLLNGIDLSPVVERETNKSYQAQKLCVPPLASVEQAVPWLHTLAHELVARMDQRREELGSCIPRTLNISLSTRIRAPPNQRKQMPIPPIKAIDETRLINLGKQILERFRSEPECWPCATISMGVANFEDHVEGQKGLKDFLSIHPRSLVGSSGGETHRTGTGTACGDEEEASDLYRCPHCRKFIAETKVLEHLDWHVAMDLSNTKADSIPPSRKRKAFFGEYS